MIHQTVDTAVIVVVPQTTIDFERTRQIDKFTRSELEINFPGILSFVERATKRCLMQFDDVPLLGLLSSLTFALRDLRTDRSRQSFWDFYGTFEMTLQIGDGDVVQVSKEPSKESFSTRFD